jgi:hypothetical protein
MGKVIGILVLTIGIWMGLEVFNNGVSGAFGGAFARDEAPMAQRQSLPKQVGSKVQDAQAAAAERRARMLGE